MSCEKVFDIYFGFMRVIEGRKGEPYVTIIWYVILQRVVFRQEKNLLLGDSPRTTAVDTLKITKDDFFNISEFGIGIGAVTSEMFSLLRYHRRYPKLIPTLLS